MSGYVKMFQSMLHSTVWREPDHVRLVWIAMLLLADRHGMVEAALPGLADAARVDLDKCKDALQRLSSPDEYSRTPDNQGRRIEAVEGGWEILNWDAYRERKSEQHRREQAAERMRRYRTRKKAEQRKGDTEDAGEQVTQKVTKSDAVTRNVTLGYSIADADPKADPGSPLTPTPSLAPKDTPKEQTCETTEPEPMKPEPTETQLLAHRLADFMAKEILEVKLDSKVNPIAWERDIELMLRVDGRDPKRVARVIRWATHDDFYRSTIRSGTKLRKHFDTLEIKMDAATQRRGRTPGDDRERVSVPVPAGLEVPAGRTVRQAIDAAAEAGVSPATVRRWNYEYTAAVTAIREKGQVPDE